MKKDSYQPDKKLMAVCGLFCPSCGIFIAQRESPEKRRKMAKNLEVPVEGLKCDGCRAENRFAVRTKTASGRKTVYEVLKLHAIGIRRYIKIKAAANPYLPEYAEYFWYRRNTRGSKLLAAISARELRAMNAA